MEIKKISIAKKLIIALSVMFVLFLSIRPGLPKMFCLWSEAWSKTESSSRLSGEQQQMRAEKLLCFQAGKSEFPRIKILNKQKYIDRSVRLPGNSETIKLNNNSDPIHIFKSLGDCTYDEDRTLMLDANLQDGTPIQLYGVLDGHGGDEAVKYAYTHLPKILLADLNTKSLGETEIYQVITEAFKKVDDGFYAENKQSGATAAIALRINGNLYVANIGDSRIVILEKDGSFKQCTEDAKLNTNNRFVQEVQERAKANEITRTPIKMDKTGSLRLTNKSGEATLNMTSSFGDFECHPLNTAVPKISGPYEINPGDCLLLASDGLFDVVTSKQVNEIYSENKGSLARLPEVLGRIAMGYFTYPDYLANKITGCADNTTVAIVEFN